MVRVFTIGLIFLCSGCFISIAAEAKTIIVSPSGNKPLTKAFDEAQDGDTVFIRSGTYREGALILKKGLTLLGENYPDIDGENQYENLLVEHDDVVIRGIKFSNSGSSGFKDIASLKIQNSKNILIEDCRFENNFFAIHTINSRYVSYINNSFVSGGIKGKPSANGIHCWKSSDLTIKGNTVKGHRDGIYLEFVTESLIEDNISTHNGRYGVHFMFSHDNVYKHNVFKSNGAGVAVMYSKRVKMIDNLFSENWGGASYGLLLKEIDDSRIEGNTFEENTTGIMGDGANRAKIIGNKFVKNGWALKVQASSIGVEVTGNEFIGNTFDMATNGNLEVKSLDGNYWDKYEGYDLDRDGVGDIPYRPITFYSIIVERNPGAMMLFRSFFVKLMDKAEAVFPQLTPKNIKDNHPHMRKINHRQNDTTNKNK